MLHGYNRLKRERIHNELLEQVEVKNDEQDAITKIEARDIHFGYTLRDKQPQANEDFMPEISELPHSQGNSNDTEESEWPFKNEDQDAGGYSFLNFDETYSYGLFLGKRLRALLSIKVIGKEPRHTT